MIIELDDEERAVSESNAPKPVLETGTLPTRRTARSGSLCQPRARQVAASPVVPPLVGTKSIMIRLYHERTGVVKSLKARTALAVPDDVFCRVISE